MPAQSSSSGTRYSSSSWRFVPGSISKISVVWNPLRSVTLSFPSFGWRCPECYTLTVSQPFAFIHSNLMFSSCFLPVHQISWAHNTVTFPVTVDGEKNENSPQVLVLVLSDCRCQILDVHNPWSSAEKRRWVASVMRCSCRYQELYALMRPAAALRNSTRLTPPAA